VDEFLELTAIANPHARIVFVPPAKASADDGEESLEFGKKKGGAKAASESSETAAPAAESDDASASAPPANSAVNPSGVRTEETGGVTVFPRAVAEMPTETKEIQPHPKGVELGILLQMLKEAEAERNTYTLYNFLQDKFCRVSAASASALCDDIGVTSRTKCSDIDHAKAEKLFKALQEAKLPPPPTDCLAPIGVRQLLAGMLKGVRAEFYAASSREPDIYRGRPFLIEAAIAFGGELPGDEQARVIRFANRVPLQYQQSACSSFKAVSETNWRNYDLQQPRGGVPVGPIVVMLHMASVWVPFTSESKEAIADYDEIRKEMKLALMECGRKLGTYLRKRQKMRREGERRDVFERYIGEIAKAVNAINGTDAKKLYDALLAQAKKRTAIADLELDEDGKAVKQDDPADQDGVIIIAPVSGGLDQGEPVSGGGASAEAARGRTSRLITPEATKPAKSAPVKTLAGSRTSKPVPESSANLFGEAAPVAGKKKVLRKVIKKVLKKKSG
jgi:DNA topoisomerase-6 subunit B